MKYKFKKSSFSNRTEKLAFKIEALSAIISLLAFIVAVVLFVYSTGISNKPERIGYYFIIGFIILGAVTYYILLSVLSEWLLIKNDVRNSLNNIDDKTTEIITGINDLKR